MKPEPSRSFGPRMTTGFVTYLTYVVLALVSIGLLLTMSGCGHSSVRLVPCGESLKPEAFQACNSPVALPEGTSFERALASRLDLKADLEKCQIKLKLLQETLQACAVQTQSERK